MLATLIQPFIGLYFAVYVVVLPPIRYLNVKNKYENLFMMDIISAF